MTTVDKRIAANERILPADLDAERAVLGAICVSHKAWSLAARVLGPADFYDPDHGAIWRAMARLADASIAIDFVLLAAELSKSDELTAVGGHARIASLADGVPNALNVEYYAQVVREKSQLRAVIAVGQNIAALALQPDADAAVVLDRATQKLLESSTATSGGAIHISEAVKEYAAELDRPLGGAIPFDLPDVDKIIGGVWRKNLTVIAARPGIGKTTFSLALATHVAEQFPVGFITLEMEPADLAGKVIGSRSGVSTDSMRRKNVPPHAFGRIANAMEDVSLLPIHFVRGAYTITQVLANIRALKELHGIKLAVVDFLQMIGGDRQSRDRQQDVGNYALMLRRAAADLDIAVVALCAVNRAPDARLDKRPTMSDIRESGAVESHADTILIIFPEAHKPEDPDDVSITEIIVAKNRLGPVGMARVMFFKDTGRFAGVATKAYGYRDVSPTGRAERSQTVDD